MSSTAPSSSSSASVVTDNSKKRTREEVQMNTTNSGDAAASGNASAAAAAAVAVSTTAMSVTARLAAPSPVIAQQSYSSIGNAAINSFLPIADDDDTSLLHAAKRLKAQMLSITASSTSASYISPASFFFAHALSHIFSFLRFKEAAAALQVNKYWLKVLCNYGGLNATVWFTFANNNELVDRISQMSASPLQRHVMHLAIRHTHRGTLSLVSICEQLSQLSTRLKTLECKPVTAADSESTANSSVSSIPTDAVIVAPALRFPSSLLLLDISVSMRNNSIMSWLLPLMRVIARDCSQLNTCLISSDIEYQTIEATGESAATLSTFVDGLPRLRVLGLPIYPFTAADIITLKRLHQMTSLILYNVGESTDELKVLCHAENGLQQLTCLHINDVEHDNDESLSDYVDELTSSNVSEDQLKLIARLRNIDCFNPHDTEHFHAPFASHVAEERFLGSPIREWRTGEEDDRTVFSEVLKRVVHCKQLNLLFLNEFDLSPVDEALLESCLQQLPLLHTLNLRVGFASKTLTCLLSSHIHTLILTGVSINSEFVGDEVVNVDEVDRLIQLRRISSLRTLHFAIGEDHCLRGYYGTRYIEEDCSFKLLFRLLSPPSLLIPQLTEFRVYFEDSPHRDEWTSHPVVL